MMGSSDGQRKVLHTVQPEDLVPQDHPLRRIRPLVDTDRIRAICAELYSADNGRPESRQSSCSWRYRAAACWAAAPSGHLRKAFRRDGVGGAGAEISTGKAERDGAVALLDRAKSRYGLEARGSGADKGCSVKTFAQDLLDRKIAPHPAALKTGRDKALMRVRMRQRGPAYQLSQRAREKIEEPWGEGKGLHGLRRFSRRTLEHAQPQAIRRPPGRH